jgi:hypothetical protein
LARARQDEKGPRAPKRRNEEMRGRDGSAI